MAASSAAPRGARTRKRATAEGPSSGARRWAPQEFFGRGKNRMKDNDDDGTFDTPKATGHGGALGSGAQRSQKITQTPGKKGSTETAQQFFARKKRERKEKGSACDGGEENIFDTPGKLGGALAGALSAAKENQKEAGAPWTLSVETPPANGGKTREGGVEASGSDEMEVVDEDEWMVEAANGSEGANGSVPPSPTPVRFETATPSQRRPPVSRQITPTRGRKRMVVGTPVPVRRYGHPHGASLGTFTQTSLAEIEARLNSKLASLLIDAEAREARLNQRLNSLATGWETAVERLSEKMARSQGAMETAETRAQGRAADIGEQLESIKKGIIAREDWEDQQWGDLGTQLEWQEKELKEIKQGVDSLVRDRRREKNRKRTSRWQVREWRWKQCWLG
jgi:hypothetical protein